MSFDILSLVHSKPTYKLTRLEFLVLLSLKKKPLHGYAIMKKLTQKTPGIWKAKSGSLYPLLRRLVKKQFIDVEMKKGVKKYHLTDKGKDATEQYITAWKELYALFKEMNKP